ncbi:hypothetical protein MXB_4023 [Myxobolus squamalis]|nr:hypothetical protein MXB_4023 [Myxobolus squamalis]
MTLVYPLTEPIDIKAIFKSSDNGDLSVLYQNKKIILYNNRNINTQNKYKLFANEIFPPIQDIRHLVIFTSDINDHEYYVLFINNIGQSVTLLVQLSCEYPQVSIVSNDWKITDSTKRLYKISNTDFCIIGMRQFHSKCLFQQLGLLFYHFESKSQNFTEINHCKCIITHSHAPIRFNVKKIEILNISLDNGITFQENYGIFKFQINNCYEYKEYNVCEIKGINKIHWLDHDCLLVKAACDLYIIKFDENIIESKKLVSNNVRNFSYAYGKNFYYITECNDSLSLCFSRYISDCEKCEKILQMGDIEGALKFSTKCGLGNDFTYKMLWEKSLKNLDSLEYLNKISDTNFVINICLNIDSLPLASLYTLLTKCLVLAQLSPEYYYALEPCQQYLDRLFIFHQFNKDNQIFDEKLYYVFRSSSIFYVCCDFLQKGLITCARILFHFYPTIFKDHYFSLLTLIPESAPLSKLSSILPKIARGCNVYPTIPTDSEDLESFSQLIVDEFEEKYIEKFYRSNPQLQVFRSIFEDFDPACWYLFRANQIDDVTGRVDLALCLLSFAISCNVTINNSVLLDLNVLYNLTYFHGINISLCEFTNQSITDRLLFIISNSNSSKYKQLELFFFNYSSESEVVLENCWEEISESYLLIIIENFKQFTLNANFIVNMIYKSFMSSRFVSFHVLTVFTQHISQGLLDLSITEKYQKLNTYKRILLIVEKLYIYVPNINFINLFNPLTNFNIFNEIFLLIKLENFMNKDIVILDLINCIFQIMGSDSIPYLSNLFSIAFHQCEQGKDLKILCDIFFRALQSSQLDIQVLDESLIEFSNEMIEKCGTYNDHYYLLMTECLENIRKSNQTVKIMKRKKLACEKFVKIYSSFDMINILRFSNLKDFIDRFMDKISVHKIEFKILIDALCFLVGENSEDIEGQILESITDNLFRKKQHDACVIVCERLYQLRHPASWFYLQQISLESLKLSPARKLEFLELSLTICPESELSSILKDIQRFRKEEIFNRNESKFSVSKNEELYYDLDDSKNLLNQIYHDFGEKNQYYSNCGYLLSQKSLLDTLSEKLFPMDILDSSIYHQMIRIFFINCQIELEMHQLIVILSAAPNLMISFIKNLRTNSDILDKLIKLKKNSIIHHNVKKIIPAAHSNDISSDNETGNSFKVMQHSLILENLEHVCLSGYNKTDLNIVLSDANLIQNIKNLNIDHNILSQKLCYLFSLYPCSNLIILLEWLVFARCFLDDDHIVFGNLNLNEHIKNVKRIRALCPDLNYYLLFTDNSTSLINSLNQTNIYALSKLFSQHKINGMYFTKQKLFSLYISQVLINTEGKFECFESDPKICFLTDLWSHLNLTNINDIINSIFFSDLNFNCFKNYQLSRYLCKIVLNVAENSEFCDQILRLNSICSFYHNLMELNTIAQSNNEQIIVKNMKFEKLTEDKTIVTLSDILLLDNLSEPFLTGIINLILSLTSFKFTDILEGLIRSKFLDLNSHEFEEFQISIFFQNISYISIVSKKQLAHSLCDRFTSLIAQCDNNELTQNIFLALKHSSSILDSGELNSLYDFYQIKMCLNVFLPNINAHNLNQNMLSDVNYCVFLFSDLVAKCRLPSHVLALSDMVKIMLKKDTNYQIFSKPIKEYLNICIDKFNSPSTVIDLYIFIKNFNILDRFTSTQIYSTLWNKMFYLEAIRWSFMTEIPDLIEIALFEISCMNDSATIKKIIDEPSINEYFLQLKLVNKIFLLPNKIFYNHLVEYCLKNKSYLILTDNTTHPILFDSLTEQLNNNGHHKEVKRLCDFHPSRSLIESVVGNFINITKKFT